MQSSAITATAKKPCHNCRRRRLKCDRSLPACTKCSRTGQACLGYGKLFLWNQGVASRGKMMGKTFPTQPVGQNAVADLGLGNYFAPTHLHASLVDPVFGDMGYTSRQYLSHCMQPILFPVLTYYTVDADTPRSRQHSQLRYGDILDHHRKPILHLDPSGAGPPDPPACHGSGCGDPRIMSATAQQRHVRPRLVSSTTATTTATMAPRTEYQHVQPIRSKRSRRSMCET
jgi:hypothetical protein